MAYDFTTEVDKPEFLVEIDRLFDAYSNGCHSTGDFIADLAAAIPIDPKEWEDVSVVFDIYKGERMKFKFAVLNKAPVFRYWKTIEFTEIVDFLFDMCGSGGWDVYRTHMGKFSVDMHGRATLNYGIYVEER